MSDREVAKEILKYAGGKTNVSKATHCVTRLRLYIKDPSKFENDKIIDELGLQVMVAGGQHQVIIGPGKVDRIYDQFIEVSGLDANAIVDDDDDKNIADKGKEFKEKDNLFNKFVALISGIFQPMLGILAGAGMIKGFTAVLVAFGIVDPASSTFVILNAIGDSFFVGLPVFVGFYAMKVFKGTPMMGAAIGLILMSPAITAFGMAEPLYVLFEGTPFATNVQAEFFGLPIIIGLIGYQYAVIPTIAIAWLAAKIEKLVKSIAGDSISLFFVPFCTILFSSIIGLLILGPVFAMVTSLINSVFQIIMLKVPVLTGILLGGTWQILVMFGLHWALIPLSFLQLGELAAGNIDKMNVLTSCFGVSFAAIGSVLGVMLVDKSEKTNAIAIPAFITGIFGITEPAIYGIILPKKIPFYTSCIGGAISGGFLMLVKNGSYTTGGLGIFAFPTYLNPNVTEIMAQRDLWNALIAAIMAFVIALVLTLMFYKKEVK